MVCVSVSSGLMTLGADISSGLHKGAIQGMCTAFEMQNIPSIGSKFRGISSSTPHNLSSLARVSMVGNLSNQAGNSELSHSFGQMNFGLQSISNFPKFRDGIMSGIPFNSPSTMPAMAMNVSSTLANEIDRNIHRVGPGGHSSHSFQHNESG